MLLVVPQVGDANVERRGIPADRRSMRSRPTREAGRQERSTPISICGGERVSAPPVTITVITYT